MVVSHQKSHIANIKIFFFVYFIKLYEIFLTFFRVCIIQKKKKLVVYYFTVIMEYVRRMFDSIIIEDNLISFNCNLNVSIKIHFILNPKTVLIIFFSIMDFYCSLFVFLIKNKNKLLSLLCDYTALFKISNYSVQC